MPLGRPLRQDDRARVKFKYMPNGRAASVLALSVEDELVILSRDSESQGWWNGRIGNWMQYFHMSYVQELGSKSPILMQRFFFVCVSLCEYCTQMRG